MDRALKRSEAKSFTTRYQTFQPTIEHWFATGAHQSPSPTAKAAKFIAVLAALPLGAV
jgi:hypothetical protein